MDLGRRGSPTVTSNVSGGAASILRSFGGFLRGAASHVWAHAEETLRPRAAVIHVFANRTNIGDWLSALGIQTLLAPVAVREAYCDRRLLGTTMAVLDAPAPCCRGHLLPCGRSQRRAAGGAGSTVRRRRGWRRPLPLVDDRPGSGILQCVSPRRAWCGSQMTTGGDGRS